MKPPSTNPLAADIKWMLGSCLDQPSDLRERSRDCWLPSVWWTPEEEKFHLPAAAAQPKDDLQLSTLLAWAQENGVVLVPRGGGTGTLGAAVPEAGTVVIDTTRMRSFKLGQDEKGPFVRAGAGWTGAALEAKLNESGLSLCHFPDSMAASTVGGWISTRSFGQLSMRYGGIEQQVLSVVAVYPGGRVMEEEASVHLGAEGTLAVMSEAALRCRKTPGSWDGLGIRFPSLEDALGAARRAFDLLAPPSALMLQGPMDVYAAGLRVGYPGEFGFIKELVSACVLRIPLLLELFKRHVRNEWVLILIFENAPEGSAWNVLARLGVSPESASRELAAAWGESCFQWNPVSLRRAAELFCFLDVFDAWAPWDRLSGLERTLREAVSPYAFTTSFLKHFDKDGACLQMSFAGARRKRIECVGAYEAAWRAGHEACLRFGARASHHRGIGLARQPWIKACTDARWHAALRERKASADPFNILNPRKMGL
ncbi:MAG: FAD-binding oxidoreductase [Elusimicrobia bacterium]|nr:FAD-binding oxidoreductase [Elusimicrobiota bacterium]